MDWIEVPPAEWESFLGRFTDEHRGWRAAIEQHHPGRIPERLIEGMPLRMILAHPSGTDVNDIAILAGSDESGTTDHVHRVLKPQHVRFARSYYWKDAAVHIVPAGGPATMLHVWTNADRDI
jgi:hypothetical protein